jgi:chromate transport protein ChrA
MSIRGPVTPAPGTAAHLARGRGLARLWLGVVGPPAIWALRIAAAYILVPYACRWDERWLMHLPSVVGVFATALIAIDAWRLWRRSGAGASTEVDGVLARSRFLAIFSVMNSVFWIIVMLAEELASIYIHPCVTSGHPLRWLM